MSLLSSIFGGKQATEDGATTNAASNASNSIFDQTVHLPEPHVLPTSKELKKQSKKRAADEASAAEEKKPRKKRKAKMAAKADTNETTGAADHEADDTTTDLARRTVFVGNLPVDSTRKTLAKLFRECGPIATTRIRSVAVTGVKLPPHLAGNQNLVAKVCANTGRRDTTVKASVQGYVVFQFPESVPNALQLNNTVVSGRRIRVDHAQTEYDARRSVFVGNLPYAADESTLQEHFATVCRLDITDIEGVRIVRDKQSYQCKGFGYVLFGDRSMVATALQRIPNSFYLQRPLRVQVCGKRFKGKQGDYSNDSNKKKMKKNQTAPATSVGALRRVLAKQQQQQQLGAGSTTTKKRRARSTNPKKNDYKSSKPAAGVSRREAAHAKVEKRYKKLQKRIQKGMGKARTR